MNAPVLLEMPIERERVSDATTFDHGKRDRVTEGPILVAVSRENLSGSLFFSRQHPHDRQPAGQQPLARDHPSQFSDEQGVRLGFNVVGDEAGKCLGRDVMSHQNGLRMIGIVCIEQGKNDAGVPQN